MARSKNQAKATLLRLAVITGVLAALGIVTTSVAAAQTIPATPTPVIAAVPSSSTWTLLLLGGVLALALIWGVRRMRQAQQKA